MFYIRPALTRAIFSSNKEIYFNDFIIFASSSVPEIRMQVIVNDLSCLF